MAFAELERRGVLVRARSLDRWVVRAAAGAIRRSVRRALGPAEVRCRAEQLLPSLSSNPEASEFSVAAALAGRVEDVADAAAAVRTLMDEQRPDEAEDLAAVGRRQG